MLYSSTILTYPVLTILSRTKRSFENMGLLIQRSGNTVRRLLHPAQSSFDISRNICKRKYLIQSKKNFQAKMISQNLLLTKSVNFLIDRFTRFSKDICHFDA